ncbi:L-2-amino-thiazoline-4-carboxylic acid hydrolase [Eubacteriales bacterium OttesenSCG-928-A19]|nr:L-2-amino-thiazoline-4-carboxylic acid hydrolase [Eubacteriales bacterium OttesenSCG-928-A19]
MDGIDIKRHVLYSKRVKGIILRQLHTHYPADEADALWESIQLQYAKFLKDLPYLGGKKHAHNGTGGTYDCIALFAYYEVQKKKPSIAELYQMNNDTFLPAFKVLGRIVNANKGFLMRLMHLAFVATAKKDSKKSKERPTGYIMSVEPYDKAQGIRYHFDRCPIAEFAKAHNYLDLMPAFCNGDYPAMQMMHAGLIRKHTCANSDICDYWIVGDKSPYLKEYPQKEDKKGYRYNDV